MWLPEGPVETVRDTGCCGARWTKPAPQAAERHFGTTVCACPARCSWQESILLTTVLEPAAPLSNATHPLLSPPRSPRQVKIRWSKGLVFPHYVSSSLIFQINIPFSGSTLRHTVQIREK